MDDHQEGGTGEPRCKVLLGLMQKNRRRQKRIGQGMLSIGYAVYKVSLRCTLDVLGWSILDSLWSTPFLGLEYFESSILFAHLNAWIPQLEIHSYG